MPEILWGPMFGTVHIITLVVGILINVALYFLLSRLSRKTQIAILFVLSFAGIVAIIFNLVSWGKPWEYLPLHLCSLNAMLLPFAVLTRKKWACNLLLLWSLGSYVALVLHTTGGMDQTNLFNWPFVFYFFPHVLEAGIPILLFALKLVEKDYKTIKSTVIITFICYTAIHFVNVAINSGLIGPGDIQVNYMFSVTPNNPLLQLFWSVIPAPYWYMLLCFPVIVIYLGVWYLPEFLNRKKNAKITYES